MNSGSQTAILGIASALALVALSSGCTAGRLVDENFNSITDWRTDGASIAFQELGSDMLPDGTEYNFDFNGQPYVSFDGFADIGATTSSFPGLVNGKFIPEGNYRVEFFQRSVGFARSHRFAHAYNTSDSCRDAFNNTEDGACVQYLFELDYNCPVS